MNAEQQLADARQAWTAKHAAESELARLRRYSRLTPGMKHDQRRWFGQLTAAEATLQRVLGDAS